MEGRKTPGVYVVEKNAFPGSVVEVATAVPAFIGYTEHAVNKGESLAGKPWRISSLAEYRQYFGGAPTPMFRITGKGAATPSGPSGDAAFSFSGKEYTLTRVGPSYMLYYAMLLFFQNGGGFCYVVSVGDYKADIEAKRFTDGIDQLIKEQEPTMVVIPEAIRLTGDECMSVHQAALAHCGGKMRNRIAILDIRRGYKEWSDDPVAGFRDALGTNYLDFAVAYYPWLNTTIVQTSELGYENISNADVLEELLTHELAQKAESIPAARIQAETIAKITYKREDWKDSTNAQMDDAMILAGKVLLNKSLIAFSPLFRAILKAVQDNLNLLPPGSAMAGVYTMVDSSRGVWNAPANVSLNSVISPAIDMTQDDLEGLSVPLSGKSINAIRSFAGKGAVVWGARTLDGNSHDWRYVPIRRTTLMLEESIRQAAKAYVFENNDANTWISVKTMVRNFLTGIWQRGGIAGASQEDAFRIHVGLGETMTQEDVLEGILIVTVLVALTGPAEYIQLTVQQQMQKSQAV